jgi:hypothetical protein
LRLRGYHDACRHADWAATSLRAGGTSAILHPERRIVELVKQIAGPDD